MSQVVLDPEIVESDAATGRWMVLIYNNETNSMEEVIFILMLATGCDQEEAEIEMWEAHTFGKAPVHFAAQQVCQDIADVISAIGVRTEVTKEWLD